MFYCNFIIRDVQTRELKKLFREKNIRSKETLFKEL